MVSPDDKRKAVAYLKSQYGASERRSCSLIVISRRINRYVKKMNLYNEQITAEMLQIAKDKPRYGYERLLVMLKRKGFNINHKRVYRIYKAEGLKLRTKSRKQLSFSDVTLLRFY